jgi:hypothetical protein
MNDMRAIGLIGVNYLRTQGLTVLIIVVYLAGMAVVFLHNQRGPEARFFVQLHSFYVVFVALMVAVPAIHADRKSRRILAVLSKGIHRWEYLGGILCGCGLVSAVFCVLVGGISLMLSLRGGYATTGLAGLMLMVFACALMTSAIGLFFATFLHPLLASSAAAATIALPLILSQAGWHAYGAVFPASQLALSLAKFQFGEAASMGLIATTTSMAAAMTILFWIGSAVIFARRDVTVAPE